MQCHIALCIQVAFQKGSWKISQYYNPPVSPPVYAMGRLSAFGMLPGGLLGGRASMPGRIRPDPESGPCDSGNPSQHCQGKHDELQK